MKWKLCFVFVLVHIEYGTPQSHSPMTPAKGDNKDLAEGEDKNYPSRLEELANSRRQALPMDEWMDKTYRNQGQGVRPKVRTGQTNRGQLEMAKELEELEELNDRMLMSRFQNLGIVSTRPESPTFIRDRDLAKPPIPVVRPIPVIRPRPVVRQNPVSGQNPVATGGNGWQTNQITAQNQNRPNIPRVNLHNLPNLPNLPPPKPARSQHNAQMLFRSRSLPTISEVPQQSWQPQSPNIPRVNLHNLPNLPNLPPPKPARSQHNAQMLFRSRSLPTMSEVPQQSWRPQSPNQNDARFFMGGGRAAARLQQQSAILRNREKKSQNYARILLEQAQSRSQPRRPHPAGTLPIWKQVQNWRKKPQSKNRN